MHAHAGSVSILPAHAYGFGLWPACYTYSCLSIIIIIIIIIIIPSSHHHHHHHHPIKP
jgi:hypothetical protein